MPRPLQRFDVSIKLRFLDGSEPDTSQIKFSPAEKAATDGWDFRFLDKYFFILHTFS